jgi:cytochrome P450
MPTREYNRFRSFLDFIRDFARGLIKDSKVNTDEKDIMSALLLANESTNPKNHMPYNEVVDRISYVKSCPHGILDATQTLTLSVDCSTLLLAGHDTRENTMAWIFHNVATRPEAQNHIKEQIAAVRARQTEEEYSAADLDSMVYTQAALKVIKITNSLFSDVSF